MTVGREGTRVDRRMVEHCCCSVTKLCPALCDPMDCCAPGLPVLDESDLALSVANCAILDKLFNILQTHFSHLYNGDYDVYFTELL